MRRREAMKKSLIIGTALVACMVVLTLMSGLAQAQSPSSRTVGVEEDEGKVQEVPEGGITPQFVDPNQFFTGDCTIGPRGGDVLFRCFNLGFINPSPSLILCQTRNAPEEFIDFTDQFACQVIGATLQDNGSVWVRIRRLDIPGSGWGQNLHINLLVIN
jgi:hypothetical protein